MRVTVRVREARADYLARSHTLRLWRLRAGQSGPLSYPREALPYYEAQVLHALDELWQAQVEAESQAKPEMRRLKMR